MNMNMNRSPDNGRGSGDTRAPRFDLRVPIKYQSRGDRGNGIIWDISSSGARIELATVGVVPGSTVRMSFSYLPTAPPVLTSAQVVRYTQGGFAVQFVNMGRQTHQLLEDALPNAARPRP